MFIENNKDGLIYMSSDKIGTKHAFTTRCGGVSEGIFSSFNLGSNRGDEPEKVRENYRRLCQLFGVGIDDCAVTNQVHENVVRIVTKEDRHVCQSKVPYEVDGIVTKEKGLPILDTGRERQIINRVSLAAGEELEHYAKLMYQTLFNVSRAYQSEKIRPTSSLMEKLEKAAANVEKKIPGRALLACQGTEGAGEIVRLGHRSLPFGKGAVDRFLHGFRHQEARIVDVKDTRICRGARLLGNRTKVLFGTKLTAKGLHDPKSHNVFLETDVSNTALV